MYLSLRVCVCLGVCVYVLACMCMSWRVCVCLGAFAYVPARMWTFLRVRVSVSVPAYVLEGLRTSPSAGACLVSPSYASADTRRYWRGVGHLGACEHAYMLT